MRHSFSVRPSRFYTTVLLCLHVGVLLLLCLLPTSWEWRLLLMALFGVQVVVAYRAWYSHRKLQWISLEQGRLRIKVDGEMLAVLAGSSRLVSYRLIVLPVRNAFYRKTLLLFPDMATAEDLRQLRVWLNFQTPRQTSG